MWRKAPRRADHIRVTRLKALLARCLFLARRMLCPNLFTCFLAVWAAARCFGCSMRSKIASGGLIPSINSGPPLEAPPEDHGWVRQGAAGDGGCPHGLTDVEREELHQLHREAKQLGQTRDILSKAAAEGLQSPSPKPPIKPGERHFAFWLSDRKLFQGLSFVRHQPFGLSRSPPAVLPLAEGNDAATELFEKCCTFRDIVTEGAGNLPYMSFKTWNVEGTMTANVGTFDRILRAALGLVLLYLAFASGLPFFDGGIGKWGAVIVGVVMLGTSALRVCPLYGVFGIKTCKRV